MQTVKFPKKQESKWITNAEKNILDQQKAWRHTLLASYFSEVVRWV